MFNVYEIFGMGRPQDKEQSILHSGTEPDTFPALSDRSF